MERLESQSRPQRPVTPTSCLATAIALAIVLSLLGGLVVFFIWVVLPMIPQRFVPNPEAYRGVGESLAFVELEPLTGQPPRLSLQDLDGRVTLLNFWGTWCPPCRDELPHLAALRERFAGRDEFQLIAISYPAFGENDDVRSLRENTEELLERLDLDLSTYWDPDDVTRSAVAQVIDFQGFPTTVLVDRLGVVRAVWVGYRPGVETQMERYVGVVLNENEPY